MDRWTSGHWDVGIGMARDRNEWRRLLGKSGPTLSCSDNYDDDGGGDRGYCGSDDDDYSVLEKN